MKKKLFLIIVSCCAILSSHLYLSSVNADDVASEINTEDATILITTDNPAPDICDTNDFSAKIERIFYENGHYEIEIMIDNKSSNSIIFNLYNSDIDNFQITIGTSCNTIDPGKKGVVKFGFQEQEFTDYGIEDFSYLNAVFSTFPYENDMAYPLKIDKSVFLKDSKGDSIEISSPSQLRQQIYDLTKENETLESENQKLKESLPKYEAASSETDSSNENSNTVSIIKFVSSVPNDVTGKWRLSTVSTTCAIENYALDYYKKLFKSDDEIHAIINFTDNTTSCLSIVGGELNVTVHQYITGEENDAKILFGGSVIAQYYINLTTGEVTVV